MNTLSDIVRILNFDESVTRQTEFIRAVNAEVVPFLDIGPSTRLWVNKDQATTIRGRLDPAKKHSITFIGSGDYHHISALLLEQFTEPFSLVVFDRHPDWDRLPPRGGCGAWVSRALENPLVEHVLLVGNAPDDLSFPSIITGNLKSTRSGRVTLLPYEVPRKKVWPWNHFTGLELKRDPAAVFSAGLQHVRSKKLYVSIDKDCLASTYALTNWEDGYLELKTLLGFLRELKNHYEIIGLDVTGDHSVAVHPSRWKAWCSKVDHPRRFSADTHTQAEINFVNGLTNRRIVDLLRA